MATALASLAFGIELELLLQPVPEKIGQLKACGFQDKDSCTEAEKANNCLIICQWIVGLLSPLSVPAGLSTGTYATWTVADEPVLSETKGYWRCEVVSRILQTADDWKREIRVVLGAIGQDFVIDLTKGCAMHVHVSSGPDMRFSASQLKQVIKGVIYYDRALIKIMPPSCKENQYCMPNTLRIARWGTLYENVPQNSWNTAFNECDQGNLIQHNVTDSGTIEFRGLSGVLNAADANHWVGVTLGFINAALAKNWNDVKFTNAYPTSDQLRAAIRYGVQMLGPNCQGALGLMEDDNRPPRIANAAELAIINAKKAAIGNKKSKFVEKIINSRPNTPNAPVTVYG